MHFLGAFFMQPEISTRSSVGLQRARRVSCNNLRPPMPIFFAGPACLVWTYSLPVPADDGAQTCMGAAHATRRERTPAQMRAVQKEKTLDMRVHR